jgi:methyl-accepting chemotaxis protein
MIVMMLIMSVGFGMFFLGREMTLLQSELKTKGETVANAFSFLIESGIDLSDRPYLQRVAVKMVEDKDIFQCSLFDPHGERLAHVVREGGVPDSSFIYYLTQPVRSGDGHFIGSLELGLSLRKLNHEMETLKTEILFLTMGMTGAGILLILMLTRILFRPIRTLMMATERVGMGELVTVDIESRDEIGELAKAFNHMTLQLRDSRMGLERKVEERTRELEKANRELKEMDETN